MAVEKWSDSVRIVRLGDDPQFTEDVLSLEPLPSRASVILDFGTMRYVNSSNIAKLLQLRSCLISADGRLVLCNVRDQVWTAFLVTGLDKVFEFGGDVSTTLAMLQLAAAGRR